MPSLCHHAPRQHGAWRVRDQEEPAAANYLTIMLDDKIWVRQSVEESGQLLALVWREARWCVAVKNGEAGLLLCYETRGSLMSLIASRSFSRYVLYRDWHKYRLLRYRGTKAIAWCL